MGKRKIYNDGLTAKQRHFKRVYENAPMIPCKCGCGEMIKSKDKYARDKSYVSGHNVKKYDDKKQHKREWVLRNKSKIYAYRKQRLYEIRVRLINELGGKCTKCGMVHDGMNTPAFDFHHIDPSTKEFNVNMASINKYSLEKISEETKKCELLCSNCHRIYHWQQQFDFMEDVE